MSEKTFPILQGGGQRIPWIVAEKAYFEYAKRHPGQSMERIAERGGFAESEMDHWYPPWRKESDKVEHLSAEVARLKTAIGDAICNLDDIPETSGTSYDLENVLLDTPSGSPTSPKALHASAPVGCKCADCEIDQEPCPTCYAAWWQKRHPNTTLVDSDDSLQAAIDAEGLFEGIDKSFEGPLIDRDDSRGN